MQNHLSMDGICKTSLALGLGSRANDHFVQTSSNNHHHHVQQKMMMKKACLRYDHMLPSLTLGLVQEDDHDHDHNKLAIATSSPILSPQEHSSNLSNGGVSSFSNSSSVKKERLDMEISTGDQEIDFQVERVITSPGPHDDQEDEEGSPRKKLRLTKQQSAILEDNFKEHSSLNPKQKQALAEQLNLRPRQVEVWFQNRRARTKLKQTEVECELLKKCCEKLTEENRRLHKELQDLKSAAPISYMHLPAATLTMCPSCERIGGGGGGGSSTTSGFSSNNGPKPHFYKSFCTHPSAAC